MTDPTVPAPGRRGPGDDPTLPGGWGPGAGSDPTVVYPAHPPTAPPPRDPPRPPTPPTGGGRRAGAGGRARRPAGIRTAIGVVLLFVAGLAAAGTVAAAWTRSQIRDEDTWAATAQALADDPQVRQAVADTLAAQVISASGADDLISGLLPGPFGSLADPLTGKATELVGAAAYELVGTDAFRSAWEAAVRRSHGELLAALDGEGRVTVVDEQGLSLDLGSTLEQLRLLLDDRGLTFLDGIDLSGIDVQFLLIDAPGIQNLRDGLEVLDRLVVVLPVVAGGAAVLGLLVARRRSWAVIAGGVGTAVGAGLAWAASELGRDRAADEVSGGVLGPAAVRVVTDHVAQSLGATLLVVALAGAGVALLGVAGAVVSSATARRA